MITIFIIIIHKTKFLSRTILITVMNQSSPHRPALAAYIKKAKFTGIHNIIRTVR
jgi:hypothetical protein